MQSLRALSKFVVTIVILFAHPKNKLAASIKSYCNLTVIFIRHDFQVNVSNNKEARKYNEYCRSRYTAKARHKAAKGP